MTIRIMTLLLYTGLIMGLSVPATVGAVESHMTMGDAINLAGRQRMLSQRIAQSYLLRGLQPESQRGPKLLNRSINEFDHNLDSLKQFKPAADLLGDLKHIESLWLPYKTLALAEVSKDGATQLIEQSNNLLAAAHAYVNKLQALSGTKKAELVNISGRQRMLSQRIAKNFLAKHWGVNVEKSNSALYEDLAEYESMLNYLAASPINTEQIKTRLDKIKGQLSYATKGFDGVMSLSSNRLIHVVTGTTDSMLRGMNEVTVLYAKLLR